MPNRLIHERSPYLRQHATNPVNWYPWGKEAFETARAERRPIFLSIGYSSCHWCHVMERESFEDPEIADILNAHFVPVKVDREERPDVDAQYMTAVQGLSGSGGWPLTAVLTPDGRPFFGGTYFPPVTRRGRTGLKEILARLHAAWTESREEVLTSADRVVEYVRERCRHQPGELGVATLRQAGALLRVDYDADHGGFGSAPKFPQPHRLSFLLRLWARDRDPEDLAAVEHTLRAMAAGGIHDHVGGGFARYSTDRRWLVPHFEKMLYDQALLARAYIEAHQATGRRHYAEVALDIFAYVLRDLRDPGGAFHCAEDADSEGEEGRYYVWDPARVLEALGPEEGAFFSAAYGVTPQGNFEGGTTVLSRVAGDGDLAARYRITEEQVRARLVEARGTMLEVRSRRVRPLKDDKVLTDWNGLMISALALGGRALGDAALLRAAAEASRFLIRTMMGEDRLLHRYHDGEAGIPAFLDDYVFLGQGLFDLYLATGDVDWLEMTMKLAGETRRRFEDPERGGFHFTASDHERLLTRDKQIQDGAMPSGNSTAAMLMLRLGALTGDTEFIRSGERTLEAFGATIDAYPSAHAESLSAVDFLMGPTAEVVVAGDREAAEAFLRPVARGYHPRAVWAHRDPGDDRLPSLVPFVKEMTAPEGEARAYLCREWVCEAPLVDPGELESRLDEVTRVGANEGGR